MSQSATPATQNDMNTSSDTWRKTRFCGFPHRHSNFTLTTAAHTHSSWNTSNVTKCHACHAKRHEHILWHVEKDTFLWLPPWTLQLYPHDGRAHTFLLKHVEYHKVPRLPRKTTWTHLLTRGERHVFVASPIDTPTLPSRRPRTHIPPETRRMSQSATPATQNDMNTSSDTWRKTRFCGFPHRHSNFTLTTATHTHSSWNTSNVTKCHACHAKRHDHIFWHVEKIFRQLYPHDGRAHTFFLKHVECHKVPRLPRKTTWTHLLTRGERHVFVASPHRHANFSATLVVRGRLRTPEAGSCEHVSTPRPPNVNREPFATHSGKNQK